MLFPKASETLDLLVEAAPVERFAPLRRDLAALYAGYYIAELLSDLTDLHDPHPKLFDAARITLRYLGESELRSRRILRFELACLRELGFMPTLEAVHALRRRGRCDGGRGLVRAGHGGRALRRMPDLPAPRRGPVGQGPGGHPGPGQPGRACASWTPAPRPWRRLVRRSGRSSVMSSGIAPDSALYWECDRMVRVDPNVRIESSVRRCRRASMRSIVASRRVS